MLISYRWILNLKLHGYEISDLDIWYYIERMPTVSAMELLNADLRPRLMGGDSSSVSSACVVTDLCLLEFTLSLSESTDDVALDLLAGLAGSSESLATCDFLFPVEFTSSLSLEFCSNRVYTQFKTSNIAAVV